MPEVPDFDRLALDCTVADVHDNVLRIAEQLRQVWNARGAADSAKLAAYLARRDEGTLLDGAIDSTEAFDRVLRSLDR